MTDNSSRRALLVDDEPGMVLILEHLLTKEGWEVVTAGSVPEAQGRLSETTVDLAVIDVYLGNASGLELVKTLRQRASEVGIVVISMEDTETLARKAKETGADYFCSKPISPEAFLLTVRNVTNLRDQRAQVLNLRSTLDQAIGDRLVSDIVTQNDAMRGVLSLVQRVAARDLSVLIAGESGTGKELVARAIHANSPRRNEEFVEVNCAAIPENLVESELFGHEKGAFTGAVAARRGRLLQANRGTLFLDEIGEMPLPMQAKLLRALQERRFEPVGSTKSVQSDFRLVCATNRDLQEEVRAGRFREDLYYRIAVLAVRLPPLRERTEDIQLLLDHFLRRQNDRIQFTPEAQAMLRAYAWPGNVRELRNLAEVLPVYCPARVAGEEELRMGLGARLPMAELPPGDPPKRDSRPVRVTDMATPEPAPAYAPPSSFDRPVRRIDDLIRDEVLHALRLHRGNTAEAARELGMGRSSLYRHIQQQNIDLDRFKGG